MIQVAAGNWQTTYVPKPLDLTYAINGGLLSPPYSPTRPR